VVAARPDTTTPLTPAMNRELQRLGALARADSANRMRFNWQTPFFLSPHNPSVIYAAGNRVLRSTTAATTSCRSPPTCPRRTRCASRRARSAPAGITPDNTGAETHGTITTLAESPVRPGILWAGTDDGKVWLSRDDGARWEDLSARLPGAPARAWVSRVEASPHDSGTVYIAIDNHRENDFAPYVWVSHDFGRTFRRITDGLPNDGGPHFVHVVREDPHNRHLLYLGSDVGAYVSTDRGQRWQRFMTNLPTVPVHDLKVHPRDRELIAGTHGRSVWIVDVRGLEQLTDSAMRRPVVALVPDTARQYATASEQHWPGHKLFQADNPPYGAPIGYLVRGRAGAVEATEAAPGDGGATTGGATAGGGRAAADSARIVITTITGDTVRTLMGPGGPGLHRVVWDLRRTAPALAPAARRDSLRAARRTELRTDSLKALVASGTDTSEAGRLFAQLRQTGDTAARRAAAERVAAVESLREGVTARAATLPAAERAALTRLVTQAAPGAAERRAGLPDPRPGEASGGGGGGGGGRRSGPQVAPGAYLVTITVAGETLREPIVVERLTPIVDYNPFGEDAGGERH
jgi:hypothetical protein